MNSGIPKSYVVLRAVVGAVVLMIGVGGAIVLMRLLGSVLLGQLS